MNDSEEYMINETAEPRTNLYKENRFSGIERCVLLGEYIVESGSTVRETAKAFSVSKSTVHKDVTEKLARVSPSLYGEVKNVLLKNKAERHLRGGEATRKKYLRLHGEE